MTNPKCSSSRKSVTLTKCSSSIRPAIRASFRKRSRSAMFRVCSGCNTLMATWHPSRVSTARYTLANPPTPMHCSIR